MGDGPGGAPVTTSSAVAQLLDVGASDDADRLPARDLRPIQLQAFNERLAARRERIAVLDRRARDVALTEAHSLADVVPVLFSHQTYKSYPEHFVAKGRWDHMNLWLNTLTTSPVEGLDTDGIADVDEWLRRLDGVGHHVLASSGTTGKSSFVDWSDVDRDFAHRSALRTLARATGVEPEADRVAFLLCPRSGAQAMIDAYTAQGEGYGRPDATFFLSDRPWSAAEANRLGSVRRAMLDGSVRPEDLEELEAVSVARDAELTADMDRLAQLLVDHHGEPLFLRGQWAQYHRLVDAARALGMRDGELSADALVVVGGGRKVASLPDDYEAKVRGFFAGAKFTNSYGMSEASLTSFPCSSGAWHLPAHVIPLVLDESGETLLDRDEGSVLGRVGLFDVALEHRWGGVITSDQVTAHFSACACGRASTSVSDIGRYGVGSSAADDKLTCAGTMEAYVRGLIDP